MLLDAVLAGVDAVCNGLLGVILLPFIFVLPFQDCCCVHCSATTALCSGTVCATTGATVSVCVVTGVVCVCATTADDCVHVLVVTVSETTGVFVTTTADAPVSGVFATLVAACCSA